MTVWWNIDGGTVNATSASLNGTSSTLGASYSAAAAPPTAGSFRRARVELPWSKAWSWTRASQLVFDTNGQASTISGVIHDHRATGGAFTVKGSAGGGVADVLTGTNTYTLATTLS